ncbi:sterol desaturase family protein [Aureibacter tunicatorum]|uniref:Sterol desaturase/sphingolipid hydroxylase (Fatty acid hydroxylase superfamily) n=1 Tax=Aureibacter tunicatorum TaxID=866807 RepID=A0AAE3XQX3_9BACT|nr:sterol desaturase family protein [Aureibacter tunicatorum]MDR6241025.1 sterol desaturase/sphingolipid hydroxylase (fatty acid hydroxylase superfamily) [Aureibacter tunicatorum]BDD03803.1 hypothetical protein AUTU_12860 [Aureibacter tunicatorum]
MGQALELLLDTLNNRLAIVMLCMVALEWLFLAVRKCIKSHKEGLVNLLSYVIESLLYIFLGPILLYGFMVWIYQYRIFTLGYEWYIWVIAFLLYDFMFYAVHYLGHKVRLFWCIHGVHHTAREMKLTVAVRGSFLGFFHTPLTIIFLPVLGFDPFMIYIVETFGKFYGLYEHVNENVVGKQPWLEKIFITPSVHRVHHARNYEYLDRNYGETFSIWDKLFGTFQTEIKEVQPVYGLMDDPINSENYFQIQFYLWKGLWKDIRNAPTVMDKVKYVFMPPGWNHIDGGKLAEDFREEALKELEKKTVEV